VVIFFPITLEKIEDKKRWRSFDFRVCSRFFLKNKLLSRQGEKKEGKNLTSVFRIEIGVFFFFFLNKRINRKYRKKQQLHMVHITKKIS
jgi:hypothetical protein